MGSGPYRVLVVDDEEDICEILRFNLESEGFCVDTASSAEDALQMLRGDVAYDLLLLDVMMEALSGFDMAQRVRSEGDDIPIIFLTALDAHDAQMQGFAAGADDYITKPFAVDTVIARVRAVLRRSALREAQQPVLPAAGLTRREYLILQLLQSHIGNYFSRSEILAAVWPGDTCVGERSVDVHIARLRKKMGSEGSRIVNKTGFGYAMV